MRGLQRFCSITIALCLFVGVGELKAAPALTNGDFTAGLSGWTTQNSGDGADATVVWIIDNPSGTDQITNNGSSGGPASRVIYQDFIVPATGVTTASFSFDYFASAPPAALNSDTFTTFDNNPGGGNNGTRIDIIDPASNVFTGAVLFNLFAPTDASAVGLPTALVSNTFADVAGLTAFLNANAGNTLRIRIGNREETFPSNTGFDNLNLDISSTTTAIPTLSEWALIFLTISLGLVGLFISRRRLV